MCHHWKRTISESTSAPNDLRHSRVPSPFRYLPATAKAHAITSVARIMPALSTIVA